MPRTLGLLAVLFAPFAFAHEVGPHKGPVAEWGDEEYHLEVVADKKEGTVTVYVFGNHKELDKGTRKPLPKETKITLTLKTDPPTTVKLEAAPDKDDPDGKCSKFTGKSEAFKKDGKLAGRLAAKVGDKPYTGDFKEE